MGKNEDVLSALPESSSTAEIRSGNGGIPCGRCRSIGKIVSLRCVLVLVVGVAVFLSAAFWLPPFFGRGTGRGDPDPDPQFRGGECRVGFFFFFFWLHTCITGS